MFGGVNWKYANGFKTFFDSFYVFIYLLKVSFLLIKLIPQFQQYVFVYLNERKERRDSNSKTILTLPRLLIEHYLIETKVTMLAYITFQSGSVVSRELNLTIRIFILYLYKFWYVFFLFI